MFACRYLAEPPEKRLSEMTAKDAVESLMLKNPSSPVLRMLKREGKLRDILYPESAFTSYRAAPDGDGVDSRPASGGAWDQDRGVGGREGGRSIRSIAKPQSPAPRPLVDARSIDIGAVEPSGGVPEQPDEWGWGAADAFSKEDSLDRCAIRYPSSTPLAAVSDRPLPVYAQLHAGPGAPRGGSGLAQTRPRCRRAQGC